MSAHITGKLILAGDFCEEPGDQNSTLARVIVIMPKDVLRAVKTLPMFQDVTVICTEEFAGMMQAHDYYMKRAERKRDEQRQRATEKAAIAAEYIELSAKLTRERDEARVERYFADEAAKQLRADLAAAREQNEKLIAGILDAPKAVAEEMDRRDAARAKGGA